MTVKTDVDLSSVMEGLDGLVKLRTSLSRSMAVAGGKVLRDEAKERAPVKSGRLKGAIYLAYKDGRSTDDEVVYSISWNAKVAPHGHLIEFGHAVVRGGKAGKGGVNIGWAPAKPFLRPAYDAALPRAQQAMIERGRERLPELLRDLYTPADEDFV